MPVNIIIGSQWGDEGKGRITDLLASKSDIVARFSGGDNAGHTVTVGEEIFKLHLVPSGVVHDNAICLLGGGVVINPQSLLREFKGLEERGVDISPNKIKISRKAHLITPGHLALDAAAELRRGDDKIGTTLRGIGPAYTDKTARSGIRSHLMASPEVLANIVHKHITETNDVLRFVYGADELDADAIAAEYHEYAQILAPYLVDEAALLYGAMDADKLILAEGAQGTMLDLDHGTYPFVTSSHPIASGALLGLGLGPKSAERIIGVAKAFSSRVGSGPFVTELDGEQALTLRGTGANPWDEYGTTTGRPRRVGWLDLVVLRYAGRINSFTELVLTKMDILTGIDPLPVCVAYDFNGETLRYFPSDPETLAQCKPIYVELPGWREDISQAKVWADLPVNAQAYIEFVSKETDTPVSIVSVGPERTQTIMRE